jgi:serine protease Do
MKITSIAAALLVCCQGHALFAQSRSAPPAALTGNRALSPNVLDDFSEQVQSLVRRVTPAVMQVVTEGFGGTSGRGDPSGNTVARQTGVASCVAVSADGDLITNAHVLNGARRIRVRIDAPRTASGDHGSSSRLVDVEIVGVDRETDLALLKLAGGTPQHLELADSSRLRQGQVVFAVGSPQSLDNSVSMGVVSAVSRGFSPDASQSFIQTDAPINPGNSGGPLINTHGEIVGIDTFILTESGGSEGLGFAIPSDLVRDVYAQLKKYGRVRRGEIGVVARSLTPVIAKALGLSRDDGVLVQDVEPGRTAAEAGLRAGDIVIGVEGRPVRNVRQFSDSLFGSDVGKKLAMDVIRGDQNLKLDVALEDQSDMEELLAQQVRARASPVPQLGVLVVPLDASSAGLVPYAREDAGNVVAAKLQTTFPLQEELEVGDIIFDVNGKPAANVADLQKLLSRVSDDSPLVVRAQRGGALRYFLLRGE